VTWINGSYQKINGQTLLEINPISWRLNGVKVSAFENLGSLPYNQTSPKLDALIPEVCGAEASGKVLEVDPLKFPDFFELANPLPVVNVKDGDYHIMDYMLFYENIRMNAVERVNNYLQRHY